VKKISSKGVYSRADIYDILFGWDRSAEFLFVDGVFQRWGLSLGDRLLEVACGTGVCSRHLEILGWEMEGLDLSPAMVEAFNRRSRTAGLRMVAHLGDMTKFRLATTFDGAYCPLGSIGLLGEDERVLGHLKAMASALRPEGLYLIDLGLNEKGTSPQDLSQVDWLKDGPKWSVHAVGGRVLVESHGGEVLESLEWESIPLEYEPAHFFSLVDRDKDWEVLACYPEADATEEGISLFDLSVEGLEGDEDRAMVLLKRKAQ